LQDFEYDVCFLVEVSEFALIGKDALQSEISSWCVYFVRTCKAKQGFGCVESESLNLI